MRKNPFLIAVLLLSFCFVTGVAAESVDAYTSASTSKTVLTGDDYAAAVQLLVDNSADMATKAQASVEGYEAPDSALANIMSVNPDGSIGLSTISQWQFQTGDDGDQVFIQLTYGQNALNLLEIGTGATLLAKIENLSYIIHLNVADVYEQVFEQAAFEAGEFNAHYSGSDKQLSSYDITLTVSAIETAGSLMF